MAGVNRFKGLVDLHSPDPSKADEALRFFETLAQAGNSPLAREILKNHHKEQDSSD